MGKAFPFFGLIYHLKSCRNITYIKSFFCIFCGGLECDVHSFVYVAHFVLLRDVWIGTQRAAVASRRATNLAIHLPNKKSYKLTRETSCVTEKQEECKNLFWSFFSFFVCLQLFSFEISERLKPNKPRTAPKMGNNVCIW